MRVVIHRRPHPWSWQATDAMVRGLARHGHHVRVTDQDTCLPCDIAVMWSVNWPACVPRYGQDGTPILVMEAGFMGQRLEEVSLIWDGLKRDGKLPPPHPQRWLKRYAHLMKPWRLFPTGRVLVIGQVPADAAVRHVDMGKWYDHVHQLAQRLGQRADFRPHPKVEASDVPLADALDAAGLVVTFNSNVGVDAVMEGVPTVAWDPQSMAWDVSEHDLSLMAFMQDEPDRNRWGAQLAGCQWTLREISDGDAWAHLYINQAVAHA